MNDAVASSPNPIAPVGSTLIVPALIADSGDDAARSFIEFFTAQIRNPHTRAAYGQAVAGFCHWCETNGLADLQKISSLHVASYIEGLSQTYAPPSVNQHLAAIRRLFDWLTIRQVIKVSPAAPVKGVRHSVTIGKSPTLSPAEMRTLLDSIDGSKPVDFRDRALIGLMAYTFARVSTAVGLDVEDLFHQEHGLWLRFRAKGGKQSTKPCHHELTGFLLDYIAVADIRDDKKGPLFRPWDRRNRVLARKRLIRQRVLDMVKRRVRQAGIHTPICNHSFRATGITTFLENGGLLEQAQQWADHSSVSTTRIYDHRGRRATREDAERVRY